MFPNVWSSLLKVKIDVEGMPGARQYDEKCLSMALRAGFVLQ